MAYIPSNLVIVRTTATRPYILFRVSIFKSTMGIFKLVIVNPRYLLFPLDIQNKNIEIYFTYPLKSKY